MLSPRAIALQGIGFKALLVAVQGLLPDQQQEQPKPPVAMGGWRTPWRLYHVGPMPLGSRVDKTAQELRDEIAERVYATMLPVERRERPRHRRSATHAAVLDALAGVEPDDRSFEDALLLAAYYLFFQ